MTKKSTCCQIGAQFGLGRVPRWRSVLVLVLLCWMRVVPTFAEENKPAIVSKPPLITVAQADGGVDIIQVDNIINSGKPQDVVVKVDQQGNREVMIVTTDSDHQKHTSVMGKDSEVPVSESPKVSIGEDGTLVRGSIATDQG